MKLLQCSFRPADLEQLTARIRWAVRELDAQKMLDVEITEHKNRRSLDANAYCWGLIDQLAVELSKNGPVVSPKEIYRNMIKDVGGNSKIVPIREDAVESWEKLWTSGHDGRSCDDLGECATIPGYHNVKCYLGSSDFDTKQMSRLIDLVVQECKQLDIETKTPRELSLLKEDWGRNGKK